MDLGDRAEDSTIDFTFSTRNVSAAPAALAGTPVLSVYKANGTTQSTAGITLTVDFDSLTGFNHVRIDTSADAFYATSNDYVVMITTGTVNSVSVIGTTIATFSIENRFMRGTNSALLAASINLTAGAVDNVTTVATTTTNTDMRGTDSALLAANINLTGGAIDNVTLVATTTTNTDMRGTDGANTTVPDAAGTAPTLAEMQTTALTESYAANGSAPTQNQLLYAVHQMLMEFAISGTSYTVKQLDSSTTAFVVALDDATNPTSNTR